VVFRLCPDCCIATRSSCSTSASTVIVVRIGAS